MSITQLTQAQTKTYLEGTKTGNYIQAGNLISLGTGSAGLSAPMQDHTAFLAHRFFYGTTSILTGTNTTTPTTLTASRDVGAAGLLGAGADVYLQFRNTGNTTIPAGTTTYFYLKNSPTNSGITLAVGGLLGVVGANSITGRGYANAGNYALNTGTFSYNGNENVGTAVGTESGTESRLLIDNTGEWYAAVTPNATYNSVRLNVAFPADISVNLTSQINATVYNAFTQSNGSACNARPQFTNPGEASGISLLNSNSGLAINQLVANPERAINNNPNDYSSFSAGVASVGVASTVSQTFYFDHPSSTNEGVKVKLGFSESLLNLTALGNSVQFTFYNGTSQVGSTRTLGGSLISLNLLDLITVNSGFGILSTTINPGVSFDRVKVSYSPGLLSTGVLGDSFRIYDVNLAPSKPTITPASHIVYVYAGQTPNATATSAGNQITWYNLNGSVVGGPAASPYAFPSAVSVNSDYYALASSASCPSVVSDSTRLKVIVRTLSYTNPPAGKTGQVYTGSLSATVTNQNGRILNYALANGSTLPQGLTLNSDGTITGTIASNVTPGDQTFNVVITDVTNGTGNAIPAGTHTYTLSVAQGLTLAAATLDPAQVGTPYTSATLPAATNGTGTITYTSTGPVNGLSFNPSTRTITGTPTATGTATFTITAQDQSTPVQTATQTYSVTIGSPALAQPAATLPSGQINRPYTTTIPEATGGTGTKTYAATGLTNGLSFDPSTRAVSGTPTAVGSVNFTVTVTDANNQTASQNYTIVINNAPDLTVSAEIDNSEFTQPGQANGHGYLVTLYEIKGVATSDVITFIIQRPANWSFDYSANATTINVNGGTTVDNANWNFSVSDRFLTVTSKPGVSIPANGSVRIGINFFVPTALAENTTQNVTININAGTGGGETPSSNNLAVTALTFN
ncbi:putative Ig domain-containing protein [Siphonobacter sp. SORGH_AS_1065]|uniref:beta strand repeat-containing protein n=1 Tax=Siphonobacter sp. SORGH_AS_1065 TaxID=3041795 RepID=UPI002783A1A2|nr:putative Ig domain-containing protein [Siphonobacter sp. SORGH_AS_1065]MDQ1087873.1 hypothetical protein [Siphonobacter sp. SORGH_AS_1065]